MSNKRTNARTRDRGSVIKPSGLRPFKSAPSDLDGRNSIDPKIFATDIYRIAGLGPQTAGTSLSATLGYPLAYVKGKWVIWPTIPTQRLRQSDVIIVIPNGQRRIHKLYGRRGEIESIYINTTSSSWRFNLYVDGDLVRSINLTAAFNNGLDHADEKYFRLLEWAPGVPRFTFLIMPDMKFVGSVYIEMINNLGAGNTLTQLETTLDMRDVSNLERLGDIEVETII